MGGGGGGGGGGQASYYSQARLLPGELYLECNSVSGHAHHFGEGGGGGGGGGGGDVWGCERKQSGSSS